MIKKIILYFVLFLIVFLGCNTKKKTINVAFNLEGILKTTIDSLLLHNVDSVLYFKNDCVGCADKKYISGYLFWRKNNLTKVVSISSYNGRSKERVVENVFKRFSVDSLVNEKLEKPNYILDHFRYYYIQQYGSSKFEIKVPEYYIDLNENKHVVKLIYIIESNLFRSKFCNDY